MLRPRVIASDLDGTLLDPSGVVSARTRAALQAVTLLGVETVFVTARPPRWLDALAADVGGHGIVLCGNGAFVYDVHSRRVQHTLGFDRTIMAELLLDLRKALPGIGFAAECADGSHAERAYPEYLPDCKPADLLVDTMEDLPADITVGKLLGRHPSMDEQAFLEAVAEVVGERAVIAFSGAEGLAEISPLGVSKAIALERWCAERGFGPDDVWAFGDMPNDLPMLGWAGTSYAVANAHPDVLAAASRQCASNADDGVAQVLETLV
ncbi:HAD hydrolase family protein [Luteipulveratus mongoliensis]|uniref:Haloacid dehalogenase n=1 Tax=Luteipulveratus mongoliensis TaxID=571913 RepID=A0A0K1JL40_9MICO|nr:HAD hydrolase family protein [Luteipulveratus mongoliensis]AKU17431.1 haloacid dehalogenase [Luteipulveratus mongoliensis]